MKYQSFEVENGGLKIRVWNLGGIIANLFVKNAKGRYIDVVLGHDKAEEYLKSGCYFGAIAGRVANRIGSASFSIDGKRYSLAKNDGKNSLHGGIKGFDKKTWNVDECSGDGWKGLRLSTLSSDMEEGFPGNLDITVYYKLTDKKELVIEYIAFSDKPTLCAPTQHSYFNLSGTGDVYSHTLKINADYYTPSDSELIPTGEVLSVKDTPLDFRKDKKLGEVLKNGGEILESAGGGLDHNFVLKSGKNGLVEAATFADKGSGIEMKVFTTAPGLQVYSANFIGGKRGKGGKTYKKHGAVCLETQFWPDAPNKPHFPSIQLNPNEQFYSATVYKFKNI